MSRMRVDPDIYAIEADERRAQRERFLSSEEQLEAEYKRLIWKRYNSKDASADLDAEVGKVQSELQRLALEMTDDSFMGLTAADFLDDDPSELCVPCISNPASAELIFKGDAAEYLTELKERVLNQVRSQKAQHLFRVAEFFFWRCQRYPAGALIGFRFVMRKCGLKETSAKVYIRDLLRMNLIRKTAEYMRGKRVTRYEWINVNPSLVDYS